MSAHLYRVAELRAIEQQSQTALAPGTLMARAGRAAAERIVSMRPSSRRGSFCVVCGPGNNGGDGFVIAAELAARSQDAICVLLGGDRPTAADADAAYERWLAGGGTVLTMPPAEGRFDAVVDALFGIGLARPLGDEFLAAADWINRRESVVAVDVPSGLDADTGAWVGGVPGVEATATVTFIGDKPGLHTAAGVDAAGTVFVEPIGTAPTTTDGILITPADLAPVLRKRRRDSHKGTYGNVLVVGGGRGMVGAALLGGRAALRLGAGRVYVDLLGSPEFRVDPMQPELMFRALADLTDLQAIVVGCGLGTDTAARARLVDVLDRDTATVIDADALNLVAAEADLGRAGAATPRADVTDAAPARGGTTAREKGCRSAVRPHRRGARAGATLRRDRTAERRRQRHRCARRPLCDQPHWARPRSRPQAPATCSPECWARSLRRVSATGTQRLRQRGCMAVPPKTAVTPVSSPATWRRARPTCCGGCEPGSVADDAPGRQFDAATAAFRNVRVVRDEDKR